jgi:cbb3-type cytochrome oxidase maturation protein
MEIIVILIAISISLALFFLISLLWAAKSGQFEDLYGPSWRLLFDEDDQKSKNKINKKQSECK